MSLKKHKYVLLLLVCIGSRLLSSIFYIEDIDSLRFGLSAYDYDVAAFRPHFPGYPLYCFLLKVIHTFTGSLGISFSLLGGVSIFIIIVFLEKIWWFFSQRNTSSLIFVCFFCPLLWLMSNRYMPDIMGLALLISALYYLMIFTREHEDASGIIFCILLGALVGVRLSFAPFFLPAIYILLKHPSKLPKMFLFFVLSVAFWFVPWLIDTGWEPLIHAAKLNTDGHFNKWGGGVMSDTSSYAARLYKMIESVWADGLGGWWKHRHWSTAILGVSWLFFLAFGCRIFLRNFRGAYFNTLILISCCLLSYSIWAYFFQNIASKPRHIMPVLPFLILLASFGMIEIEKILGQQIRAALRGVFFSFLVFVCVVLVRQHQKPSAISQISTHIMAKKEPSAVFYSKSLINYYLSRHIGLEDMVYISLEDKHLLNSNVTSGTKLFSTVAIDSSMISGLKELSKDDFYHNPYVNRLWYNMRIYTYIK